MTQHHPPINISAGDTDDCRRAIWYRLKGFTRDASRTPFNTTRFRAQNALKEVLRGEMRESGWEIFEGLRADLLPQVSSQISIGNGLNLFSTDQYDIASHPEHTGGQPIPVLMMILNHDRYSLTQHLGPQLAHPAQTLRLAAHHRRYQDYYGDAAPRVVTYDVNEHVWGHEQIFTNLVLIQAAIHLSPLRKHLVNNVQEPPERDFETDSRQCQRCAFFNECQSGQGRPSAEEIMPWQVNNPPDALLAALEAFQDAEAALQTTKALSAQRVQAKDIIETYMDAIPDKSVELTTPLGKARVTRVPGSSNVIDTKLARELLGERWAEVATNKQYTYARITLAKEPPAAQH